MEDKVTKELVFLDTETTGVAKEDRLIQIAYKTNKEDVNELFKPELPIKIESMAVCHITNKMVEDKLKFQGSEIHSNLVDLLDNKNTVLIAHNAKFDIEMLKRDGVVVKNHICTYKIAQYLDKEGVIPKYNLQYLRYLLGLDLDVVAHDAMGDVLVLEALFKRLFDKMYEEADVEIPFTVKDDVIRAMIDISMKPVLIKMFTFGKHKGRKVKDVVETDRGYLEWLQRQKQQDDMPDEDWLYTLKHYL